MVLSFLRAGRLRVFAVPLALLASACSHESVDGDGDGSGGMNGGTAGSVTGGNGGTGAATGGSGNNSGTAGSGGPVGGSGATGGSGGSGVTGGTGGIGAAGVGGTPDIDTVPCMGNLPTEDVTSSARRVTAGGTSWGGLPHFWSTYGLGRMGLYLAQSQLPAAFQAQDKTNFDGRRWSDVLKEHTT